MQIVFHIGANCTDDDLLLQSLLKNAETFAKEGVKIPAPGKYRRLIRETIQTLNGQQPQPEARDVLLDTILDEGRYNRLVMSHSQFICVPKRIFEGGVFYALAEEKLTGLANLFPNDDLEIFLALRDPATFIPAVLKDSPVDTIEDLMGGLSPFDIRWSDLVARIRDLLPRATITVWCNEETPLFWAQLIREMGGVDPMFRITGGFDLLSTLMSPNGMKHFAAHLKEKPPENEKQKRQIIAAFLNRYAMREIIEEEIDIPGWTDETVSKLSAQYDADVRLIEQMEGIDFIAP